MQTEQVPKRSPITWVPTLYFAQGLPFFVVMAITTLLFKDLGVSNTEVTRWVNILGWAWVLKPLWSPFLEAIPSKKLIVVVFQLVGAATMGVAGLALNLPDSFIIVIAVLAFTAIGSATHDIASDGLYIASLSNKQQAEYAGWQGAFFNAARLFSRGGILVLVGALEKYTTPQHSWSTVFLLMAAVMGVLALYHWWALPDTRTVNTAAHSMSDIADTMGEVLFDFLKKPGIWFAILFIVLFRAGEGQIQSVGPLFLKDPASAGGLGLSTDQIGVAYGTAGTIAFVVGSVFGGYFTSWLGLRRAMVWLVLAMNLPNLAYWWLSVALPSNMSVISAALAVEMFGYGFGFVGIILFIMQVVAVGRFTTAHYALGTGVMQLGFVLSGTWSGAIQTHLGYQNFFIWVTVCAIPVLVLSFFLPKPRTAEPSPTPDEPAAEPAKA
ncbi:MFS transporter [Piscinibacter terrae]|uniref:MFS transporter n=1 Tax=Piscinibacter terrae TaxID=2496871 RepID=A0A3N7JIB8_9BURK|nr:MFS transporter [Albitalea terrae]RQP21189.1 MFS transporter [Albitalea terrae]